MQYRLDLARDLSQGSRLKEHLMLRLPLFRVACGDLHLSLDRKKR